jgi:FkbM family methyltransferase
MPTFFLRSITRSIGRQNWLRFGIRDRLARLIEDPDTTRGCAFKQTFFGGTYQGNTSNFIDWSARYFGAYAIGELECFAELFPSSSRDVVVLDVGANVGHHTLFYALMGASGIAFEPNPQAATLARAKLKVNQLSAWTLEELALSDHKGVMDLYLPNGCNLGTASLEQRVGARTLQVPVLAGDCCPSIQQLSHIDYIKIDVEGHELSVLRGLNQTLSRHRPVVFFEWNARSPFSDVRDAFPEGYTFRIFHADQPRAFLFNRPGFRLSLLRQATQPGVSNLLAIP